MPLNFAEKNSEMNVRQNIKFKKKQTLLMVKFSQTKKCKYLLTRLCNKPSILSSYHLLLENKITPVATLIVCSNLCEYALSLLLRR